MRAEHAVATDCQSGLSEVNAVAPVDGKIARRSGADVFRDTARPGKSKMSRSEFKADIAGGSLKLPESRIVAANRERWASRRSDQASGG